jgi:pimeloyl-ACP methyl ester carboxylesterase
MEKSILHLDWGKIAYWAGGQGENLLLLHSLNLSAEAWGKVTEPLSRSYRIYAWDMPGHGDSDKPPKNYLVEDYARDVVGFMDRLSIDSAIVCGNSVGALIALELAASSPRRVAKLILVGCPVRDPWERLERLTLASLTFDVEGNPRPFSLADLTVTFPHPTPDLLQWFNRQRGRAGLWVKKTLIAVTLYEVIPKLTQVKCPTLVLFGEQDIFRDRDKLLLQKIKGARSAIIQDGGHVPQVDKPQEFLREVSRFLSGP